MLNKLCVYLYLYNYVVIFLRNSYLFNLKIGSVYFLKLDLVKDNIIFFIDVFVMI